MVTGCCVTAVCEARPAGLERKEEGRRRGGMGSERGRQGIWKIKTHVRIEEEVCMKLVTSHMATLRVQFPVPEYNLSFNYLL